MTLPYLLHSWPIIVLATKQNIKTMGINKRNVNFSDLIRKKVRSK
jgi:hypothetical protein